jgi:DNA-binding NtrC family response regulator
LRWTFPFCYSNCIKTPSKLVYCIDAEPIPEVYESLSRDLPDVRIRLFASCQAALTCLPKEAADAIVFPMDMEPGDLGDAVSELRTLDSRIHVVACAREESDEPVPPGIDRVIFGYLTPVALRQALTGTRSSGGLPNGMIGCSPAMEETLRTIRKVAPRRSTVLITGETGTGKEVAARALYQFSSNSKGRFVAVNCTAIPAPLLEAELFGHTRGAFTGAVQQRVGRFEEARQGTIFLDEIGDLPIDLQGKLLRVLQEHEFQRLGSSETILMEARVLAATNVNLHEKMRDGLFRQDLYYRLNVVSLSLPPLRARVQDIPALANHFVERVCAAEGLRPKTLTNDALRMLACYSWPGNIRQLENAVETAVVLSDERPALDVHDFRLPFEPLAPTPTDLPDNGLNFTATVVEFETRILRQALTRTAGNKKMAARLLGLKRTTLSAKVRSLETTTGGSLA